MSREGFGADTSLIQQYCGSNGGAGEEGYHDLHDPGCRTGFTHIVTRMVRKRKVSVVRIDVASVCVDAC